MKFNHSFAYLDNEDFYQIFEDWCREDNLSPQEYLAEEEIKLGLPCEPIEDICGAGWCNVWWGNFQGNGRGFCIEYEQSEVIIGDGYGTGYGRYVWYSGPDMTGGGYGMAINRNITVIGFTIQ